MRILTVASVLAFLWTAGIGPALAESDHHRRERVQDEIGLDIKAEGWVETTTARVIAVVDASLSAEQVGEARAGLRRVLQELAPEAQWHITGFSRAQDPSGLEQWRVEAETRLPEAALGTLNETARALSRPGRKVRIAGIDFTPTMAEMEAALSALRQELYASAEAELARVRAQWPDRDYRIHRIDVAPEGTIPAPRLLTMRAEASYEMASAGGGGDFAVSRKLMLAATVVLATGARGN
jgi:hypothetical protein